LAWCVFSASAWPWVTMARTFVHLPVPWNFTRDLRNRLLIDV
jgi:hypothetical protein